MVETNTILSEIQKQYLSDKTPWVIGFSGGKDSTAVLQMLFYALSELPKKKLTKEIHVISNDTLVENPAILKYLNKHLRNIKKVGKEVLFKHKPDLFKVRKVKPKLEETFWVNLIGRGYPAPNRWFRWCTERMKINPTSNYVLNTINKQGEVIIVLGTRKAESSNRATTMNNYSSNGKKLRKHTLPNAFVYSPIEDLSNNDVWSYLLQAPNPWGCHNRELLGLYGRACQGGECPFVIETGTQSCGKSRFGCWVCTVVDRDKCMENLVDNGATWMKELLDFRNWLYDIRQQDNQYVPKRIESKAKFASLLLKTRREIFAKLLDMQKRLPAELITSKEKQHIRKILKKESNGKTNNGLKKFVYKLANGKRVATISDFNVLHTPRKRLGPLFFRGAKLTSEQRVNSEYSQSTRVMYYLYKNNQGEGDNECQQNKYT